MSHAINEDQVMQLIESASRRIAAFGRVRYRTDGRGVTLIIASPMVPCAGLIATGMIYYTLAAIECVAADRDGWSESDDATALLWMLKTYDPSTQAVVTVRIVGGNPVSVEMNNGRLSSTNATRVELGDSYGVDERGFLSIHTPTLRSRPRKGSRDGGQVERRWPRATGVHTPSG
jgi:hypothetical protein